mgnify:CR=1 FL=1
MAKTTVAKGSRLQAENEREASLFVFMALMFISLGGCRGRSTVALLILFVFYLWLVPPLRAPSILSPLQNFRIASGFSMRRRPPSLSWPASSIFYVYYLSYF